MTDSPVNDPTAFLNITLVSGSTQHTINTSKTNIAPSAIPIPDRILFQVLENSQSNHPKSYPFSSSVISTCSSVISKSGAFMVSMANLFCISIHEGASKWIPNSKMFVDCTKDN